jgi:hypothetical protein
MKFESASFTVGLLTLLVATSASAAPRRVAVVPFEGMGSGQIQTVVGASLQGSYTVIIGDVVSRLYQQVRDRSPASYVNLARKLRVSAIVEGRLVHDDRWRLRVAVRQGSTGQVAGTVAWSGGRIRELATNVARGIPFWLQSTLDGGAPPQPRPEPVAAAEEPAPAPRLRAKAEDVEPREAAKETEKEEAPVKQVTDDEVPPGLAAKAPAESSGKQTIWEISAGPRILARTFTYTDNLAGLPGYTLQGALAVAGEGELYPLAGGSDSSGRNFGIAGHFETSLNAKTVAGDGTVITTKFFSYFGGGRYRIPVGNFTGTLGLDYGEHRFEIGVEDQSQVPNVRYTFVRPSLRGRFDTSAGFSLLLTAAYLNILNVGGMNDPAKFPRITAQGAEIEAAIAYALNKDFEVQLMADLRHYAHNMHVQPGDTTPIVGGALDEHFGAALFLTYKLR